MDLPRQCDIITEVVWNGALYLRGCGGAGGGCGVVPAAVGHAIEGEDGRAALASPEGAALKQNLVRVLQDV